jgi:hypothetical protein
MKSALPAIALAAAFCGHAVAGPSGKQPVPGPAPAASWKDRTISPVANLLYFEDPVIRNEIRPAFIYHRIDDGFITGGGEAYLAGAQLRLALTDRLQFIANKGGYLWIDPEVGSETDGWANLVAGLKYALIDSEADQFILTPGLTYEIPLGEKDIFHGTGDGILNLFVSAAKGWGDFHLTGYAGYQQALDTDANSSILQFNLQADYWVHRYFIPFITLSTWTVLGAGNALPLTSEGYDTINFGSSGAEGVTQATLGAGFRTRLADNLDIGVAYQKAVASPEGLFDDRVTIDMSFRW